jgi:hypothetical protein
MSYPFPVSLLYVACINLAISFVYWTHSTVCFFDKNIERYLLGILYTSSTIKSVKQYYIHSK